MKKIDNTLTLANKHLAESTEYAVYNWLGCEDLVHIEQTSKSQQQVIFKYLKQTPTIYIARSNPLTHEYWSGSRSLSLISRFCQNLRHIHFAKADFLLKNGIYSGQKLQRTVRTKMEKWIEGVIYNNSHTLEKITGDIDNWISTNGIVALAQCKNLTSLIERCDFVPTESKEDHFIEEAMNLVIVNCPKICVFETTALNFPKSCQVLNCTENLWPQLHTVSLSPLYIHDAGDAKVEQFFNHTLPSLSALTDLSLNVELKNKRIWKSLHGRIQEVGPQLIKLSITNSRTVHNPDPERLVGDLEWTFKKMKNLELLNDSGRASHVKHWPKVYAPQLITLQAIVDEKSIEHFSKHSLQLENCISDSTEIVETKTMSAIKLLPLQNLKHFDGNVSIVDLPMLGQLQKITNLNFTVSRSYFLLTDLLHVLENCTLLTTLYIYNGSPQSTKRGEEKKWHKQVLAPNLIEFSTTECSQDFLNLLSTPLLTDLTIQSSGCDSVTCLESFLTQCPKLHYLSIINTEAKMGNLHVPLVELQELCLDDLKHVTSVQVCQWMQYLPCLSILTVNNCTISETLLVFLASSKINSKLSYLQCCQLISRLPHHRLSEIVRDLSLYKPNFKTFTTDNQYLLQHKNSTDIEVGVFSDADFDDILSNEDDDETSEEDEEFEDIEDQNEEQEPEEEN